MQNLPRPSRPWAGLAIWRLSARTWTAWLVVVIAIALGLPSLSYAQRVVGVADGDTLTLLTGTTKVKIRLSGIDAPEKKQAFGQRSKQSLSDLCFGRDAEYQSKGSDRYGRIVARVRCAGIDVNRAQIERGMAWVYDRYNDDRALKILEASVRQHRIGLWADTDPVPPWEYRHTKKMAKQQPRFWPQ